MLLHNKYPVISSPTSSKGKESDESLYTVARYGPRTSCQRKELNKSQKKSNRLIILVPDG